MFGVTIINRKDCCGERLKDIEITSPIEAKSYDSPVVGTFKGPGNTGGEHFVSFGEAVTFTYIRFQMKGKGILQINGIKPHTIRRG